jgi:SAM-dependent methyltransferase
MAEATEYSDWVLSVFGASVRGVVAEIGIGHGAYVGRLFARPGYTGVDLDPKAVDDAQRRFPLARFVAADISNREMMREVGFNAFDTVLCCNVLEHVPNHRQATLNMLDLLRPGGRLLLFVPALQSLYGALDRLAGHERRYDKAMLRQLLGGLPATLLRLEYLNPVGGLGWWLNSKIEHRDLDSAAVNLQIKLFTKYIMPLSRAITPLTKGFFGQSLLVEAERY